MHSHRKVVATNKIFISINFLHKIGLQKSAKFAKLERFLTNNSCQQFFYCQLFKMANGADNLTNGGLIFKKPSATLN
jgi:hypothetical protein